MKAAPLVAPTLFAAPSISLESEINPCYSGLAYATRSYRGA